MLSAWAQDATTVAQPSPWKSLIPLVLIGFIFYFLMIRPQKKRFQKEQDYLNSLQKGDEVYTKSGVIGTIVGMNDKLVTLEIADNVKIKILKSQVGGPAKALLETNTSPAVAT